MGRLDQNKDPLTVLKAFEKYIELFPAARLYMIYQTKLLDEIEIVMKENPLLRQSVILCGAIPHNELVTWYSAADFYISGSHREGGSIALIEAMACGCIPIVTSIPSALKTIEDGRFGLYFDPGNVDELLQKLVSIDTIDRSKLSADIETYFNNYLSPKAIANRFMINCNKLISE